MSLKRNQAAARATTLSVSAAALLAAALLAGCSQQRSAIVDTLPKATHAWPWALQDEIWTGTFEQASGAFGEESQQWGALAPDRVWLAIYRHESHPDRKLTVRALAFSDADRARRAFGQFQPPMAQELNAGDAGCWTDDGVLVLWGRMVFDIFASGGSSAAGPAQAAYLLGFIERNMPPDLTDNPR